PVDFHREPQNSLGKLTDPSTGWSYHGARWMQPQTARWTTPDPLIIQAPGDALQSPSASNPYHYGDQNPQLFWDPDGAAPQQENWTAIDTATFRNLAHQRGFLPDIMNNRVAGEVFESTALNLLGLPRNTQNIYSEARWDFWKMKIRPDAIGSAAGFL